MDLDDISTGSGASRALLRLWEPDVDWWTAYHEGLNESPNSALCSERYAEVTEAAIASARAKKEEA